MRRLASLPRENELQTRLSRQYIEQGVAAAAPVSGRVGALTFHGGVGTVNVYITIVNGDDDDTPPLITVQGQ